jgi:hypothetical protein
MRRRLPSIGVQERIAILRLQEDVSEQARGRRRLARDVQHAQDCRARSYCSGGNIRVSSISASAHRLKASARYEGEITSLFEIGP